MNVEDYVAGYKKLRLRCKEHNQKGWEHVVVS